MGSGMLKSLKMEVELRFLIITYNKILKPIITQNKQTNYMYVDIGEVERPDLRSY